MRTFIAALATGISILVSCGTTVYAEPGPLLGQPGSEAQQKAVIAEIRAATPAERSLLIDIAVSCDPSTNIGRDMQENRYLSVECDRNLKRYNIEFMTTDFKREIERQFQRAALVRFDVGMSIFDLRLMIKNYHLMEKLDSTTFQDRQQARDRYSKAIDKTTSNISKLSKFFRILGICLNEAKHP